MTLEDKDEVISLAQDVESKCAALLDDHVHGFSLGRLAVVLSAACKQQEALAHLNDARIMLKAAPYLADTYQVIARVHFREGRLPEALDAIQEACKLVGSRPDPDISLESGLIHFSANRDIEAWNYTEIALMRASHVGNRLCIARALELMGYGYLRRGDYENAYGAYEAAGEKYCGTVRADVEMWCKDNMARIERKQRNPDEEIGFSRSSLDVDYSFFYPPVVLQLQS